MFPRQSMLYFHNSSSHSTLQFDPSPLPYRCVLHCEFHRRQYRRHNYYFREVATQHFPVPKRYLQHNASLYIKHMNNNTGMCIFILKSVCPHVSKQSNYGIVIIQSIMPTIRMYCHFLGSFFSDIQHSLVDITHRYV